MLQPQDGRQLPSNPTLGLTARLQAVIFPLRGFRVKVQGFGVRVYPKAAKRVLGFLGRVSALGGQGLGDLTTRVQEP